MGGARSRRSPTPTAGKPRRRPRRLLERPGASCSNDHRDLLASGLCDALVIASPNFTHIEVMRDALATDLHILVEKPLVTKVADGVELIERARAKTARASSGWRRNTATCRRWPR